MLTFARVEDMSGLVDGLIAEYELKYRNIVNPGNLSWKDLGYDKKPKEYATPLDCILRLYDFDEGQQASMDVIREVIEDLKVLKGNIEKLKQEGKAHS